MAGRWHIRSQQWVLLGILGALLGCTEPSSDAVLRPRGAAQPSGARSEPPRPLASRAGVRVLRHLGIGEVHAYEVELRAGTYLLARLEQRGVDAVVSLAGPSGQEILQIDNPNGTWGPEPIPLVASASGAYQLSVRALDGRTEGDYELSLLELRPATDLDKNRFQGAVLFARAEHLRQQPRAEDREAAMGLYREAMKLRRLAGATWDEAIALRRLGQMQVAGNRHEEALRTLSEALVLVRRLSDLQQEAGILSSLGRAWQRLGRPEDARRAYERAIHVARAGGASLDEAIAWNNLATLHQNRGELEKALAAYDRALVLWRRFRQQGSEATVLHNIGTVYLELGRLEQARDCLVQSLTLLRRLGTASAAEQAVTLAVLGQTQAWNGEPRAAVLRYREAMALARRTGERRLQAILLDKLGSAHLELGRVDRALVAQEWAASIFHELGARDRLAWVQANLAWLHERQGRPERALSFYTEASGLFRQLGDRTGEAFVLLGEARIARKRGDLDTSLGKLEAALSRIESLRRDAPGPALRSSYFASRQAYYDLYIELLMELHQRHPGRGWNALALQASERTRARSFLDTLGTARAGARESADRDLLRRDRDLLDRLDALERARLDLLARKASDDRISGLARRQRELLLERETLLARMRDESPRALPSPIPLTVAEIQERVLDPETLLLVYALGEERSFLWLVDQRSVRSFVLPDREQIDTLARGAYELLSESGTGAEAQARLLLSRLSGEILGPAAALLDAPRLLVVADGALRYIPFGALPAPSGHPGGRGELVVHHEIVSLDSPSVMAMQRRRLAGRPRPPFELAVVADPVFGPSDPRLAGLARMPVRVANLRRSTGNPRGEGFERLAESGREAEALLRMVPGSRSLAAVGFAADRETVLSGVLSRYRIVHIATHGLIHPRHPELSALVLSLADEQGRPQDGFLRAYELHGLNLPADLVVLSGCRTALGQEIRGEGLVGMTRGLMVAGAARLVVSLWSVEDRSTAELMRRFYRGMLGRGLKPAAALREAQLSMLREARWSDPRHWAAFVLQGEWR